MEKNKIIVGNMKMNLTLDEVKEYIEKMKNYNNFIICPSYIYVPYFLESNFKVGVQNISEYGIGSYTGDISVMQVASMGIKYTLVGHSERREKFGESDKVVNNKIIKAISNNLTAILCVGETNNEKMCGKTKNVLYRQLTNCLEDIEKYDNNQILIAYEPVWAIGTGNIPTDTEIIDNITYIKSVIEEKWGITPNVLYGGSINEENIKELNKIDKIDGFLIGGACLKPNKFIKILNAIN